MICSKNHVPCQDMSLSIRVRHPTCYDEWAVRLAHRVGIGALIDQAHRWDVWIPAPVDIGLLQPRHDFQSHPVRSPLFICT